MHRHSIILSAMAAVVMLAAACSEDSNRKSTIKDYLSNNLASGDYSIVSWGKPDSTGRVRPEMIEQMRAIKKASGRYRQMPYGQPSPMLHYINVEYTENDKDTISEVFYLNKDNEVVAIK